MGAEHYLLTANQQDRTLDALDRNDGLLTGHELTPNHAETTRGA
jgi:hypothetical protein